MTREEILKDPIFQETLKIGLEEQWKYSPDSTISKTGKGFLRSSGVLEIQRAKKEDERTQKSNQ